MQADAWPRAVSRVACGQLRWQHGRHLEAGGSDDHDADQRRISRACLDGDEVGVEANSEARLDRVLTVLHGLQAGLEVLSQARDEASDLMEAMSRAPGAATGSEPDLYDPAVAAALEAVVLEYERTWLDEPIPALAGVTPRDAAADPTRRPDLLRLLDSFPRPGPGLMDADRLRAALGL